MVEAILGWLGMAGTFLAYVLLSRGRVASQSNLYLALNAIGGLLGAAGSLLYGAWPSAVSNFLWAAFSLQPAVWSLARGASRWGKGAKPLMSAPGEEIGCGTASSFRNYRNSRARDVASAQGKPGPNEASELLHHLVTGKPPTRCTPHGGRDGIEASEPEQSNRQPIMMPCSGG